MKIKKLFSKWIPIITGFLALIWFLIRVIPKPSRATYPCQRAAFPIASGFVIWLISTIGSIGLLKHGKKLIGQKYFYKGLMLIVTGSIFLFVSGIISFPDISSASTSVESFTPSDPPNTPMGIARGVHPGRVVWVYDKDATSWDGNSNYWWSDNNVDQEVVDTMAKHTIQWLTGIKDLNQAWDTIFKFFNANHEKGYTGYSTGEKIAIKVNMNSVSSSSRTPNNYSKGTPQVVLSYIKHLVDIVGVSQSDITIYDKSRYISTELFNKITAVYPNVLFMDETGNSTYSNWSEDVVDYDCEVKWSENLTLEREGGNPTYLPETVSQADYLINLANLKGHNLAGVTMNAKNHFGTFYAHSEEYDYYGPKAAGVHFYMAAHDMGTCGGSGQWDICGCEMETYNALVDLMGHEDIGDKTLLFILDALYCSKNQGSVKPNKWSMSPFNNDWTSSLFASLDGVAIESVGVDFLRSEPTQNEVYGSVDNYLHEASQANNPPSGTFYDPEGDGTRLSSLGVHEHWNNTGDKEYTRNLGTGSGIELIYMDPAIQLKPEINTISAEESPGIYNDSVIVHLSTDVEGASIYYTKDGSDPDQSSLVYSSEGIKLRVNTIIKAIAYKDGTPNTEICTFSYTVNNTTAISEGSASSLIEVFPNPVQNTLRVNVNTRKEIEVRIYTVNGRLVYSDKTYGNSMIDLSGQPSGIYLVNCRIGQRTIYHEKLIKE